MDSSHNWLISPTGLARFQSLPAPLPIPISYFLHLVVFTKALVLGSILFTIYVSPIASIINCILSIAICWRYTGFSLPFPVSLPSSLCILQRCVSSLHSWFLDNGLVLNPTKTEAICVDTGPRLQSLSNLTSIEVPLVDYVKLLAVTFDIDKHISNVWSPSSFHFHIRALRHIRPFLDSETSKNFFFSAFKTPWDESFTRSTINTMHLSSKFTSLASNTATNQFEIGYSCSSFTPHRRPSILVIFTTSLHSIASASLSLL